jgi:uncharacterized protein (TIGR03000 family)
MINSSYSSARLPRLPSVLASLFFRVLRTEIVMKKLTGMVAFCLVLSLCATTVRAEGEPEVKVTPTEKGKESKIRVLLPTEDTKFYCDGKLCTKEKGKDRTFKSPALEAGKRYTYRLVATWIEDGKEVSHDANIEFRAGEDILIDFRR